MLSRAAAATALCGLPALYLSRNGSKISCSESGDESYASRAIQINALKNPNEQFDLVIIGGGITGSGCALEAQTRGLNVALIEKDDFASESSSRSTKLIHGGLRYLEKVIRNRDWNQYKLVQKALKERGTLLKNAPHISDWLPVMIPIRKFWDVPYFWAVCFFYDMCAGFPKRSYFVNAKKAIKLFPQLDQTKEKLFGCMVYHDGQMDDARVCMSVAKTASKHGAIVANYVEVTELIKDENGIVIGAKCVDKRTDEEFEVKGKQVLSAVGCFSDDTREMEDENASKMVQPSRGTHLILPGYLCPEKMGLLDPKTSDGRVLFYLPWEGSTLVGSTDIKCDAVPHIKPLEEEIDWVFNECKKQISSDIELKREDIKSAWCGIRPLVRDPSKENTQEICRNHVVHTGKNGMVTVSGGKWTTYRAMAEHAIDIVQEKLGLPKDK
eukprot:TRINITY_DN8197_c0_g1_i2.p1 TRINITY_DN8197_c0_g1~~TRINITY_DN8197_c0_g1_i2.p1  ORF type:complete len:440 (+),score=154.33 TRINITY_DN8197_c0_g1_i2:40-1359(+)